MLEVLAGHQQRAPGRCGDAGTLSKTGMDWKCREQLGHFAAS